MKALTYFLSLFVMFVVVSCSSDSEEATKSSKNEPTKFNEITQIKSAFESKDFQSIEEASAYANSLIQDIKPISRAINEDEYIENVSPEVWEVIDNMRNIKADTEASPEALRTQLKEIVKNSSLSPSSTEYGILMYSVDIAIEAIYYAMELEAPEATTRGFWGSAWKVVKCVAGTAGSAGLGAVAGAGVGTVTLPVIGSVSGTALGGWSGALVGIATFC